MRLPKGSPSNITYKKYIEQNTILHRSNKVFVGLSCLKYRGDIKTVQRPKAIGTR